MKFDINNLPPLKIRITNTSYSERAQRAFFSLGYKWSNGANAPKNPLFIFADSDGSLDWVETFEAFCTDWGGTPNIEITLPELEQLAAEKVSCQLDDAADKWVFETNADKWSNNDNTAGDNYGSFIAGAKWAANAHCGQNTCLAMNAEIERKPEPTAQDATLGEKFFAYWEQEHNILTLHSDFVEMQRLFKADEHSAQERYDAAMEYYEENKGHEACDHFSALFKALKIAAGLPIE